MLPSNHGISPLTAGGEGESSGPWQGRYPSLAFTESGLRVTGPGSDSESVLAGVHRPKSQATFPLRVMTKESFKGRHTGLNHRAAAPSQLGNGAPGHRDRSPPASPLGRRRWPPYPFRGGGGMPHFATASQSAQWRPAPRACVCGVQCSVTRRAGLEGPCPPIVIVRSGLVGGHGTKLRRLYLRVFSLQLR